MITSLCRSDHLVCICCRMPDPVTSQPGTGAAAGEEKKDPAEGDSEKNSEEADQSLCSETCCECCEFCLCFCQLWEVIGCCVDCFTN